MVPTIEREIVSRSAPHKPWVYLSRLDNQTKVLGYPSGNLAKWKQYLGISGGDAVIGLGWPAGASADKIELFLESRQVRYAAAREPTENKNYFTVWCGEESDYA